MQNPELLIFNLITEQYTSVPEYMTKKVALELMEKINSYLEDNNPSDE